jgi:isoleucyl-tRNA synthetase
MATHRPVAAQPSFPALEREVLARWRERDTFAESLRRREGAPAWVFSEGPPTANGRPGAHHVLARVFKDIFPRFHTMCGQRVERKGGWDCHGLPVELEVERALGFTSKEDIERYGIAAFNARCRETVFTYVEEWTRLTERIGFWIDLGDAYRTMDADYVQSVWWALRQIWEQGLLSEGHKVVPYCPRCGTALSSHELGQPGAYRDVVDPSVYVTLPVTEPAEVVRLGDELVVWTTTPWTLPSNAAVAVHPDLDYVRARVGERVFVVAEALAERVLGSGGFDLLGRFAGADLVGTRYAPPFDFIPGSEYGPRGHTVLPADFVSAQDGTGLVHTAVAFGEDDFRLGAEHGLAVINPVRPDGTFDERIGPYAGRRVKEADADLVTDLRARGRLLRAADYEHAYPHCWRCGTPLLYYATASWYIRTSARREELLTANETIGWHPEHIKHGRFGDWLANNVDWALSRDRYWGTPLPIWRCGEGHVRCLGSLAELEERSGVEVSDPHRPFVDDVTFACEECGSPMTRVPKVIDVWFDSGAMPFAQFGAPHVPGSRERARERFPADFICEALDQTRGWFYSMLAVSTLVCGRASFANVVCLGLIVDGEGHKMSKSRGNTISPWGLLDRHGADALRWYFLASKQPWEGYRLSDEAVAEAVRGFLLPLWNVYAFCVLYANATVEPIEGSGQTELDRWIRSRLQAAIGTVREGLDAYDATSAGRAIAELLDDLTSWYVRRSRPRFWRGERAALGTLQDCLVTLTRLLAPFCPFVADEIHDNLVGGDSVHLADFPSPDAAMRDAELEAAMAAVRATVRLGHAARSAARVKLRQPLREAVVVAAGAQRGAIERLSELVRSELNVKALRFVSEAGELGRHEVKPNYRALGPRFASETPLVAKAIAALDPDHVAAALAAGRTVGVVIDGHDHDLGSDDLQVVLRPIEGYGLQREDGHAVALDLELTDALAREGLAREVVHAVQQARRDAGLDVSDRIALALAGDAELLDAARDHADYVAGETLAERVDFDGAGAGPSVSVDGRELRVALTRR